jgi:hypothetical protein
MSILFNLGLNRCLSGIVTDRQADVTRCAPHYPQDGRPVVVHRPCTGPVIRPSARRIVRIAMFFALFACILKHFIRLGHAIGQGLDRPVVQPQLLNSMASFEQGAIVQFKFVGEVQRRNTLNKTAHDQNNGHTVIVGPLPHRARQQVEHIATLSAAVVNQRGAFAIMGSLIGR